MAAVVLVHVSGPVVLREDLAGTPVELLAAVMNAATLYGVPLFVLVSGALLLRERSFEEGIAAFYRWRLARILPALVAWHLVYLGFRLVVLDQALGADDLLAMLLTGRVYTGLYFFWVVLGLSLLAPFLWRALVGLSVGSRLVLGVALVALVEVWRATLGFLAWVGLDADPGAQTIWTVWIPYVGLFVLGGALREVTPRRSLGWMGAVAFLLGAAAVTWQLLGGAPPAIEVVSPFGRWSVFVVAATVGLWLAGSWFWRDGTWAARGRIGRLGDALGSVTLGVFGVHLLVIYALQGVTTPGLASGSIRTPALVALAGATLVVSWTIAWGMSRVPGLRRIV
jgi:surface polysaccharide O-acyltransferase-like enzyme